MHSPRPKVLIAAPVHAVLTDGLNVMGYELVVKETITQQLAYALIGECVGVITSTRLQLDRELLEAAPGLQWIGRMGSGMEVIDVPYATQKGIQCYGSPDGNCNAVAEHALGMLLALIRRISWSHTEMKNGIWKRDENRGYELEGKTVGIIGYGHTGAAFARKLLGFDVRLMAYDKYHPQNIPAHIECCDLAAIHREADIVSFHVPLQADTIRFFDSAFTEAMHKPFIFVNTSRGQVADTLALYDALKSGKVTGACLDVFEQEPVAKAEGDVKKALEAMIHLPNVITTPHIAGYTHEALYKMSRSLLEKIGANHGK